MTDDRRTPRARPETLARRAEILRAATATFAARGYGKGPLTEIAEQVGMTHAGVLHHFGSKDRLLLEVLRHRDETDVEHLPDRRVPDGIELLRHLVRTALANERRPGIVQAFAVLSAESVTDDHPARPFFTERYRTLRGQVRAALEVVCAERGVDAPATVDRAAAAVLAAMDGLQVQWLLAPDEVELAETSAFAIEAVLTAVLDSRPSPLREESDAAGDAERP
ncbi:TetR/AcrR family transcriptional regulator [Cellulomonas pakistanensis]|uniref:TetR family transcriptional regulator n=1 Tax=Cellulomonas pakistanensis TaxID=992287 RepID=A0A919P7F2_9CELL|nr:TetR/AcrR family transcriptional regulator [Cellulomonas pakistanensis]GIG35744.1 TetR family transcriptional regulator [Cellulomonas pakistanensis]